MIYYKVNVIAELKKVGYNTNRIRKEKLLSEGSVTSSQRKQININEMS